MNPNVPQVSLVYVVPSLLGFAVLLGLALLAILRGGGRRTNLLFAAISFLAALLNADIALIAILPDEGLALRIDRTIHLFFVFSIPAYLMFVHEFLGIRRRRIEIAALLFSIAFLPFVPTELYYSGVHYYSFGRIARAGPLFHLFSAAIAVMIAYCLALLHRHMANTGDNLQRNRIRYIFWGMGLSALLLAFTILPVSGIPVYPLGNFSFIPAAFLAYGVLKYDLLDIGVLIRRGTVYFLLTGILTALYILIISSFHALFLSGGRGGSFAISVILALVIVILFNPVRERLQAIIDRLFFRGRYDYQELLREISGKMATLLNLGQIRGILIGAIGEALQVEGVSLVMAEKEGFRLYEGGSSTGKGKTPPAGTGALIAFLEREGKPLGRAAVESLRSEICGQQEVAGALESLGAALVIPIPARERLAGMIALGQKKSGELFVEEDLKLLTTIANQAATAVENAQSYEALEALNRELEQKVTLRTAALREALAEKERTQEQLIRSESLSSIGQLVAGTAHELNNPIASAMSLVETSVEAVEDWKMQAENREEVVEDLRFSLGELRRAGAIIRSLLDLSRQTQTYTEPVDINRALDDALRVLFNQYKNIPVEIVKDYDDSSPTVQGNFANLGQVFINVIRNALQALPGGRGKVALSTRRRLEKGTVVIECSDTGGGIPAALLKDIFKPFFTTKAVGRGTGLGLYLSHEIIRRHGGEIRVASEPGEGTTVIIELPLERREP